MESMRAMKIVLTILLGFILSGCAVLTVNEHELQPGSADAVTFSTTGRPTYDQGWAAATKAMSSGMKIVYSHKPSGTIKSRVGADHTGKVVAFFITPTTERAPKYTIELVSKKPMGLGQPERRNWEPSVVKDFEEALNQK
jgi:uncharacterized protein YceK